MLHPDRFPAVISLSTAMRLRAAERPSTVMPQNSEEIYYQTYFQNPGIADAELGRDTRKTLRSLFFSASGDRGDPKQFPKIYMVGRHAGFLDRLTDPTELPPWLSEDDLDHYTAEFRRTGFTGGLNWYRNIDTNWELFAPFAGQQVNVPALYVLGDRDIVMTILGLDLIISNLAKSVPNLRQLIVVPGCGHWTQQERPHEVNAAMLAFLNGLA